jgi:putative transposase
MNQKIIYKIYSHNPPHLFIPNAKYLITASTYLKRHYFKDDPAKEIVLNSIIKGFSDLDWKIDDLVILDNHYHLMVQASEEASNLSKIVQNIHKFTALRLKKYNPSLENVGKIWFNYWDTCITYEKSYFARINYIWFNPVKHGYVDDALKWRFGSYYSRMKQNEIFAKEIKRKYPFDRINVMDDF